MDVNALQAEVAYWQDRCSYYQVRCRKFIDAARKLMDCEKQRQAHQDTHREMFSEEVWVPPRQGLYQQSVDCIGDVLHGIDWKPDSSDG